MSNYAIVGDYANLHRPTRTKIILSPQGIFYDISLDDSRLGVLYKTYLTLLAEQYSEQLKENKDENRVESGTKG